MIVFVPLYGVCHCQLVKEKCNCNSTVISACNILEGVAVNSRLGQNKDLVSLGTPGDCSMIDHFMGDAVGVLSFPFWSTVLQCGARLPIHTLNYWTVQSVVPGS